ncbi:MAG: WD40 repeat domain-containing protein [Gemmataceae bacterium]|nr:WD40 repeat domain-containing protein [Gemmataceae bacterium]
MARHLLVASVVFSTAAGGVTQPFLKPRYDREQLRFNTRSVQSVAVSADGKYMAVGTTAGLMGKAATIFIVDAATGKAVRTIAEHQYEIDSLSFSKDGRLLFSGSKDTTIGVWEVATGKEVKRLDGHRDRVTALAVSEDGRRLVSCTGWSRAWRESEEFRVWDLGKNETVKRIPVPASQYNRHGAISVKITPDLGFALAIVGDTSSARELYLIDLANSKSTELMATNKLDRSYLTACAISADGKVGVSAHDDLKIRYWDLTKKSLVRQVQAPRQKVVGLAFTPDGSRLALDHEDGSVRMWDAKTDAEQLRTEAIGGKGFSNWGNVVFTSDGKSLVTTTQDYVFIWDVGIRK